MPGQDFLIANFQVGLEKDVEPFLLTEDAFPTLEDAYVFRGKVKRRFGFNLFTGGQLNSRLRINVATTAAITGDLAVTTMPGIIFKIGQMFSIGTTIFTVNALGNPADLLTTAAATGTFDTTTGNLIITGNNENPNTTVFFYPSEPVMGLRKRESITVNFEDTIAFDTQFAYTRSGGGWDLLEPLPTTTWTGTNFQFFWTLNYRAANAPDMNFYVVNGVRTDNIKYMTQGTTAWINFRPTTNAAGTNFMDSCRILITFKGRLVALNILETQGISESIFENRCRFSQVGDPVGGDAWESDTVGKGGFIDAPISQAIVSVQFIQNRLIVYFEQSTWELVYTGNELLPFLWQRINTELGAESTFSEIPFDDGVIAVGNRGIHIANTSGVQRIDQKIPDQVGQINNSNNGQKRVYGIRDFSRELVMWTFPLFGSTQTFPNKVLVYNYRNNTFAIFNDSFTCYGYHQKSSGLTWATLPYGSWAAWTVPWNAGLSQAQFPLIIAGNQQGWTFLFEETGTNDDSLFITDVTIATRTLTVPDHNLRNTQLIRISNLNGITITPPIQTTFKVSGVTTDTFVIDVTSLDGKYLGGGTIEVLNNFEIVTKNIMPFAEQGSDVFLNHIQVLMTKTTSGEISMDIFQDFNTSQPIPVTLGTNAIRTRTEDNDTFAENQNKIWHTVHRQIIGDSLQLKFFLNDAQMRSSTIQPAAIELHAILLNVEPTGRLK